MTDLTKLDDLIRRAEGETDPIWKLLLEAAELLFGEAGDQIWAWCDPQVQAYDQAALHLMREALPDWHYSIVYDGDDGEFSIELLWPTDALKPGFSFSDLNLARAILLATLKARKAMVEG